MMIILMFWAQLRMEFVSEKKKEIFGMKEDYLNNIGREKERLLGK